jgi:hypothetical protein
MKDDEETHKYKSNCETLWIYESEVDCVLLSVVGFITGPICFF